MTDSIITKLVEFFQKLPGIGPRQARRFVYSLVDEDPKVLGEFSDLIKRLKEEVSRCARCFRIFSAKGAAPAGGQGPASRSGSRTTGGQAHSICEICSSSSRDDSKLLVLEKDADLENMEKNHIYDGRYHILGGLISPLKPKSQEKLRLKELYRRAETSKDVREVILALSATTEGDMTVRYIEKILEPIQKSRKLKISRLARGLATGAELEYSDRDTLQHAFDNRK